MAERRDIALLLQLEAHLIDAAGSIDREHEREVDLLAGIALLRAGGCDEEENCKRECAPDQAATRCIAAPAYAPWIAFTERSIAPHRAAISAAAGESASYSLAPSPYSSDSE